jgi:wobble nucleotide-excising tRNase
MLHRTMICIDTTEDKVDEVLKLVKQFVDQLVETWPNDPDLNIDWVVNKVKD